MKRLRTWKLFQIFSTEIKKSKTYNGWYPITGLSNGTTPMQIQSGRTVPLKRCRSSKLHLALFFFSLNVCYLFGSGCVSCRPKSQRSNSSKITYGKKSKCGLYLYMQRGTSVLRLCSAIMQKLETICRLLLLHKCFRDVFRYFLVSKFFQSLR